MLWKSQLKDSCLFLFCFFFALVVVITLCVQSFTGNDRQADVIRSTFVYQNKGLRLSLKYISRSTALQRQIYINKLFSKLHRRNRKANNETILLMNTLTINLQSLFLDLSHFLLFLFELLIRSHKQTSEISRN